MITSTDLQAEMTIPCHFSASLRLEAVQSNGIAGTKRNVLLYKGKNSKALQMESMQHVSLSGERGGPSKMVESRIHFARTKESKRI